MIGGIFASLNRSRLHSLIGIRQLLYALLRGIFGRRKPLWVAGLAGAVRAYLSGILPKFVELCLIVTARSLGHNILQSHVAFGYDACAGNAVDQPSL
jgi:hypothetical protein